MKRIVALLLAIVPALAVAEPSSNIAWTPELLEFVGNGDAENGQQLAQTCAGCHGDKGVSPMEGYPSLAGQLATYTYKQLRDYADGKRSHMLMNSIAQGLSEKDSADIAAWFATLPPAKGQRSKEPLKKAEVLVTRGNGKKIIPSCFVCHGSNGQGEKQDIPALSGQQPGYFINTLNEYKTGVRHNDIYSRMRLIAQQLSEEDIKQLAQYYYQMRR
ncbi:c-type cytochrome [Methylomarinum vadi]|uniref:c-type cytochrome n=1 Tax=Methylomarinum vadi TaxID=438855 RepID=UPI0004DF9C2A|nr:c-type cytochrome [Methylomarinum vadi]